MLAKSMAMMAETLKAMHDTKTGGTPAESDGLHDEPAVEGETLMPTKLSRTQHSVMTGLLEALGLGTDDLDLRPSLFSCVTFFGYDTTFPFRKMLGAPLDNDLADMLDENAATTKTRAIEQAELQASQREDAGTFEKGKGGTLQRVAGRRPKLSKPAHKKEVKTYQDMLLALYNLAYHYERVGQKAWAALIAQHIVSLRQLWDRGSMVGSHAHIIDLDKALRHHRCRTNVMQTWNLDELAKPGTAEATIMLRTIQAAQWAAAASPNNSSGPGEDQSGAGIKAKTKAKAEKDAARAKLDATRPCPGFAKNGVCNRKKCPNTPCVKHKGTGTAAGAPAENTSRRKWPDSFWLRCSAAGVCTHFAWTGSCFGSTTEPTCTARDGSIRKHTCIGCDFAKGPHDLVEGVCTNP
jgi:murein DD-endopeptidase MepM/ murein hydrolase activator NlpD